MASNNTPVGGDYWNSWLNTAKDLATKAQELAETAGKVAQEHATHIVKQAQELRENYDLEVATSILMSTVGGPLTPNAHPSGHPDQIKLTKADLSQLDMIYVTENIISMAYPIDKSIPSTNKEGNDINIVAAYLKKKHQGRFMIWNISEEAYDYSKFSDQVLDYKFPGHPAPPLGLLFKICTSVESWLDADEKNVAVIHCLTGKGRTATLIACILTWLGEFDSPMQALQYVAQRRGTVVDYLTIPSQRRYLQYFSNLLDGVKPNSEPLLLRRVIINSIPIFGKFNPEDEHSQGCCPYIQLFKNGKLIATAAAYNEKSDEHSTGENQKLQLKWCHEAEGSVSFHIDCPVQGDILLRCRHAATSGAKISMFRAAFHTGYISGGVLRLTKAQLDGSAADSRYSEDFFIDLIFAPMTGNVGGVSGEGSSNSTLLPEAAEADKYESSIHKDARFWESVSARKLKSKKRKTRKFMESTQEQFSIADDVKFLQEQDSMTEISFMTGPDKASSNYENDMDLIKQLALAEDDSPTSSNHNSSSTLTEQGIDDDFALIGSKKKTASSVPEAPSTPVNTGIAKGELQALEDLEKELGLSDLHLFSNEKATKGSNKATTSSATTSAPAAAPSTPSSNTSLLDDDDNLDELEKYLQSLSSNK